MAYTTWAETSNIIQQANPGDIVVSKEYVFVKDTPDLWVYANASLGSSWVSEYDVTGYFLRCYEWSVI